MKSEVKVRMFTFTKKYGCPHQHKRKESKNNNGWRNWKLEVIKKKVDEKHVLEPSFLREVKTLGYPLNEMRLATTGL